MNPYTIKQDPKPRRLTRYEKRWFATPFDRRKSKFKRMKVIRLIPLEKLILAGIAP